MLANPARKSIHGVVCNPNQLPPTTPSTISVMATDSPNSTEAMLASKTSAPAMVAMSKLSKFIPPGSSMVAASRERRQ